MKTVTQLTVLLVWKLHYLPCLLVEKTNETTTKVSLPFSFASQIPNFQRQIWLVVCYSPSAMMWARWLVFMLWCISWTR